MLQCVSMDTHTATLPNGHSYTPLVSEILGRILVGYRHWSGRVQYLAEAVSAVESNETSY